MYLIRTNISQPPKYITTTRRPTRQILEVIILAEISPKDITITPYLTNVTNANSVFSNMASLPKTYKAAVFQKANDPLTIIDVELKLPAAGEVLVKVLAVGMDHIKIPKN
jgi:hypothetical protein